VEFIEDDELVEITPKSVRLRKRHLKEHERKRASRDEPPRMKLRHGQAVWLMVAVTLMWSIAGVVTRQLEHAKSFEVTFWRSFFTMVSLLVILPLWQGRTVFRDMHWKSPYFWLSGVCWSVMFTAFMVALTLTTVANVLVTMALGPLFTALISRVFIGHKLPARTWGRSWWRVLALRGCTAPRSAWGPQGYW
jgi:uncharacterized membrane protein